MLRSLFYTVALLACFIVACKSDNKDAAGDAAVDSTGMATPSAGLVIDSAAVAAKWAETHPSEEQYVEKRPAPAKATKAEEKPATTTKTDATAKTDAAPKGEVSTKPIATAEMSVEYVIYPSQRATYPGGEAALNKYLAENLKYPKAARDNSIEGTVYANIYVDELGKIVDVTIASKPIGYGLEDEVKRVIYAMPKLIPAKDHSKPVKTKYVLPVTFNLQ